MASRKGPSLALSIYTHLMGFCWGLNSGTLLQSSAGFKMKHEAKRPWTNANPSRCSGLFLRKR